MIEENVVGCRGSFPIYIEWNADPMQDTFHSLRSGNIMNGNCHIQRQVLNRYKCRLMSVSDEYRLVRDSAEFLKSKFLTHRSGHNLGTGLGVHRSEN
jgi:hypothetical protein